MVPILLSSCSNYKQIETDLYFGLAKPGGEITGNEWQRFNTNYISKIFSEGYTIINTNGYWNDTPGNHLSTENSYLLINVHQKDKELSRSIDSLREKYKMQFQQQSVLRVDRKVKANF